MPHRHFPRFTLHQDGALEIHPLFAGHGLPEVIAQLPGNSPETVQCGKLMAAAPDLLDACCALLEFAVATTPEEKLAICLAQRAVDKATT